MATHTWVDLRIPEAKLLADLHGVVSDLRRAREFAELLIAQHNSSPPNWHLVEPLSIAVTVAYARAFSGGVRHYVKETDLNALTEDQLAMHRFLRDFRDKHAAHSVNEFEENIVQARYCVERVQDEGITAIGYGGGRVASLGGREIQAVIEITKILEMHLENQIKEEQTRLLALVRKMPLEQVLAGGQKVFQPSLRNVAQRRK